MLPEFNKLLNYNEKKKLIVIHMIGSNPYPCDRTKGLYDEFIF